MFHRFFEQHQQEEALLSDQLSALERRLNLADQALAEIDEAGSSLPVALEELQTQCDNQSARVEDLRQAMSQLSGQTHDFDHAKILLLSWQKQLDECEVHEAKLKQLRENLKAISFSKHRYLDLSIRLVQREKHLREVREKFSNWEQAQQGEFELIRMSFSKLASDSDLAVLRSNVEGFEQHHRAQLDLLEKQYTLDKEAISSRLNQLSQEIEILKHHFLEDVQQMKKEMGAHQHQHYQGMFVCAWNEQKEQQRLKSLEEKKERERVERNQDMIEQWRKVTNSSLNMLPEPIVVSVNQTLATLDSKMPDEHLREVANRVNRLIANNYKRPSSVHGESHAFHWQRLVNSTKQSYQLNLGWPGIIKVVAGGIQRTALINAEASIAEPIVREKLILIQKALHEEIMGWSKSSYLGKKHGIAELEAIHYAQLSLACGGINELCEKKNIVLNLSAFNLYIQELNSLLNYRNQFADVYARDNDGFKSAEAIEGLRQRFRRDPRWYPKDYDKYLDVMQKVRQFTPMQDITVNSHHLLPRLRMNANSDRTGAPVQAFPSFNL